MNNITHDDLTPPSQNHRAARWYAEKLGWAVFPLHSINQRGFCTCGKENCSSSGKHPRTLHGVKDAICDVSTIDEWWTQWPNANIGVACGSKSGILVLDIDPRNGGDESLEALIQTYGPMPDTVESITGGGGQHLFFNHPASLIRNSSGALRQGLDIKTDGGYVVLPPSLHVSGRHYEWEHSSRPDQTAFADPPEWLIRLLTTKNGSSADTNGTKKYEAILEGNIREGKRNETIASISGYLLSTNVSPSIAQRLIVACNRVYCDPPLDDNEVMRTVESIAGKELAKSGGRHE